MTSDIMEDEKAGWHPAEWKKGKRSGAYAPQSGRSIRRA